MKYNSSASALVSPTWRWRLFSGSWEREKSLLEDLDAKLREVAARHLTLLKQVEIVPGANPQLDALKKSAVAAIGAGDYARAQALLEQAFDADLVAARKALDTANQRYVTAAKTKADLGQLKLSQLQYEAAAREFQTAADLVPASEPLIRARYLAAGGGAALSAGIYPLAETALTEALRIREKQLAPDHVDVASSGRTLADLYREQGRYVDAEPLSKRALAIGEKALGLENPQIAIPLSFPLHFLPLRLQPCSMDIATSVLTSAAIRCRRIVATEFGMWRSGRNGGASGSITVGNGKLREERGGGRS